MILSVNAQILGILVQYAKTLNGGRDGCDRSLCITSPGDTDEVEAENFNFVVQLETRKGCSPNTIGSSSSLECTRPCSISDTHVCVRSWIVNRFGEAHKKVTCLGGWEKSPLARHHIDTNRVQIGVHDFVRTLICTLFFECRGSAQRNQNVLPGEINVYGLYNG